MPLQSLGLFNGVQRRARFVRGPPGDFGRAAFQRAAVQRHESDATPEFAGFAYALVREEISQHVLTLPAGHPIAAINRSSSAGSSVVGTKMNSSQPVASSSVTTSRIAPASWKRHIAAIAFAAASPKVLR